jgi:hypothetical protein
MESKIDRNRVSVSNETEVIYWTVRLGADEAAIVAAIEAIGDNPGDIAGWLQEHHLCRLRPERPSGSNGLLA